MSDSVPAERSVEEQSVTAVIPYCETYTPESMLTQAVESVEDQVGVDTEVVVVEDEDERGPAWARNVGIERAETRYVALLDADDTWHRDKLRRQLRELADTGAGLCVDGSVDRSPLAFTRALLTGETHSLTSSILIDTTTVTARFDESLERREDHLFMIEAAMEAGVCFTTQSFDGRDHEDGFSNYVDVSPEGIDDFFERVLAVAPGAKQFEAAYYSTAYTYLGRRHHFDREYGTAVGYYVRAMQHRPTVDAVGAFGLTVLAALYDYPRRLLGGARAGGTHE